MTEIDLKDFQPEWDVPPIPRNFQAYTTEDGKIYCCSAPDKRKRRSRVPDEPRKFWLTLNEMNEFVWVREGAHPTEGIREFMLEQGLRMETLFGMKMTAKAPKVSTILREEYGMTGTPLALYMQFCRFKRQKIHPKMAEKAFEAGEIT